MASSRGWMKKIFLQIRIGGKWSEKRSETRIISLFSFVQAEIKAALKEFEEFPDFEIFIIPVRINECEIPFSLEHLHWVTCKLPLERGEQGLPLRKNLWKISSSMLTAWSSFTAMFMHSMGQKAGIVLQELKLSPQWAVEQSQAAQFGSEPLSSRFWSTTWSMQTRHALMRMWAEGKSLMLENYNGQNGMTEILIWLCNL